MAGFLSVVAGPVNRGGTLQTIFNLWNSAHSDCTTSPSATALSLFLVTKARHCACLPASIAKASLNPAGKPSGNAVRRRVKVASMACVSFTSSSPPSRSNIHRSIAPTCATDMTETSRSLAGHTRGSGNAGRPLCQRISDPGTTRSIRLHNSAEHTARAAVKAIYKGKIVGGFVFGNCSNCPAQSRRRLPNSGSVSEQHQTGPTRHTPAPSPTSLTSPRPRVGCTWLA